MNGLPGRTPGCSRRPAHSSVDHRHHGEALHHGAEHVLGAPVRSKEQSQAGARHHEHQRGAEPASRALSPADWEAATAACKARSSARSTAGLAPGRRKRNSNSTANHTIRQHGLLNVEIAPAHRAGKSHVKRWRGAGPKERMNAADRKNLWANKASLTTPAMTGVGRASIIGITRGSKSMPGSRFSGVRAFAPGGWPDIAKNNAVGNIEFAWDRRIGSIQPGEARRLLRGSADRLSGRKRPLDR